MANDDLQQKALRRQDEMTTLEGKQRLAAWDTDPALRSEFSDNYESYRAFKIAEQNGQAHTPTGPVKKGEPQGGAA